MEMERGDAREMEREKADGIGRGTQEQERDE